LFGVKKGRQGVDAVVAGDEATKFELRVEVRARDA
jgi:hypothetical protein